MCLCSVQECKNTTKKVNGAKAGPKKAISFHCFPSNPIVLQKWVQFCRRSTVINTKTARVCSEHFQESDFENISKYNMGFDLSLKLKRGSVPTIRTNVEEIPSNRMERIERANRKELVNRLLKSNRGSDGQVENAEISSHYTLTIELGCKEEQSDIGSDTEQQNIDAPSRYMEGIEISDNKEKGDNASDVEDLNTDPLHDNVEMLDSLEDDQDSNGSSAESEIALLRKQIVELRMENFMLRSENIQLQRNNAALQIRLSSQRFMFRGIANEKAPGKRKLN